MAGKSRTGKGKSSQSRKPRSQTAPVVSQTATAAPAAPVRRRHAPVITDLNQATAERYPYVVRELKQVGILAAAVVLLLIVLFFALP